MTYPAADAVTARAAVVAQHRAVVPLTSWIADALRRRADDGRAVQIVTLPGARLTRALRAALPPPPSRWVVHDGDGYYDGLSGLRLAWDGTAFVPAVDARGHSRTADRFVRTPDGLGTVLVLSLIVRHPVPRRMALGWAAERLTEALAGVVPSGWGPAEPVALPWQRAELCAAVRERDTRPTFLIFRAGTSPDGARAASGTLRVTPAAGIEEVELAVGYATGDEPPFAELAEVIGSALADVPFESLLVVRDRGFPDLTVVPHWVGVPVPAAMAIGPRLVHAVGRERALHPPEFSAQVIGGVEPSAWYSLGGYEDLHRLVQYLGGGPSLPG